MDIQLESWSNSENQAIKNLIGKKYPVKALPHYALQKSSKKVKLWFKGPHYSVVSFLFNLASPEKEEYPFIYLYDVCWWLERIGHSHFIEDDELPDQPLEWNSEFTADVGFLELEKLDRQVFAKVKLKITTYHSFVVKVEGEIEFQQLPVI